MTTPTPAETRPVADDPEGAGIRVPADVAAGPDMRAPPALADTALEARLLALASRAGPDKSICPSEVARDLEPTHWRPLMSAVRRAALRLQAAGRIAILRKGKPVAPEDVRGVIRLRIIP